MTATHTPIIETARAQVKAWLEEHEAQEDVHYDVSMIAMPTAQPGAFQPALVLCLSVRGAVITDPVFASSLSFSLSVPDDQMAQTLTTMLVSMKNERSRALAEAGQGVHHLNGSGILLPGQ